LDTSVGKNPVIGEAASIWLAPGQHGKILAVVSRAAYLLTESGELIWLISGESPMHRRCIRWPVPLPNLAVDTNFVVRGRSIVMASGTSLDLGSSEIWQALVIPGWQAIDLDILSNRLFPVVETFLSQEMPLGVGLFIRPVLQIARKMDANLGLQSEDIVTGSAWPAVEKIARACLCRDFPGILKEAGTLTGLGEGLTPSGDDFLGGLFFACFLLSYYYPSIHFWELDEISEWVDAHQSRTNQISFTLLRDNASGNALDPLNRFGIALLTNQPVETVISAASDLIEVGHSTGWSLLAGFLTGMLQALPN
jgi:hypothetical protein